MKNIKILLFITLLVLTTACASRKKASPVTSPYQRKPIVETTEEQLKYDAAQIDATTQQLLGNYDEAIKQYQALLRLNPSYAPAHFELGKVFLGLGRLDSALVHTQQACKQDSKNSWYQRQLAQIYMLRQDSKNVIATWENLVRNNPDNVEFYYDLSNAYLMTDNVTGSIEVLDRLEKRFGVSEPVSLQKQKLWNALKKPENARKELEKLAESMPGEPRYNAILAESYMSEKNYQKALQYYNRILESNPSDENINISLASCHLAMGNLAETYRYLRQGLNNPAIDCQHKLMFLTEFLRHKNFFAAYSRQCFRLADTLSAQCPANDGHAMIYGQMLAAQERYAEAAKQFQLHLQYDKSQYAAWEALLICEETLPDQSEALLEHAKQASELFPLHLRPYLILAEGYMKTADCEKAKYYIERCLMIAPNDISVKQLNQKIKQQCQ